MAAANPVITRDEFDRIGERLTALEASRTAADAENPAASYDIPRPGQIDFVRQDEFRLFKWLGSFALVAILGGFGLLYEQSSDLRVAMERLHADLLREMHAQTASIREDMHEQHSAIRNEIARVRERVVRLETLDGVETE